MPRAATAIIAIACSTSYLGSDTGIVPGNALRCDPKTKRARALSKRVALKQPLVSEFEAAGAQDETILAGLVSWSPADIEKFSTDIETNNDLESSIDASSEDGDDSDEFNEDDTIDASSEYGDDMDDLEMYDHGIEALTSTTFKSSKDMWTGAIPASGGLPDDLLMTALKYTGAAGRAVCRAAQRSCDILLREGLLLPAFPVKLCVKQHYHFNSQRPVTTKWSLDVAAPETPCSLEVCTESGSEDNIMVHQASQSGKQVLRLCQEMRALQTTLGTHHKEGGRTQVEVSAIDAAGHVLLDHAYDHRIFWSKADDLLELLTESELHVSSGQSPVSSDDDVPAQSPGSSRTHRHAARARPVSRSTAERH